MANKERIFKIGEPFTAEVIYRELIGRNICVTSFDFNGWPNGDNVLYINVFATIETIDSINEVVKELVECKPIATSISFNIKM